MNESRVKTTADREWGRLLITLFGIYAINDYVTPLGAPYWRLAYGLIVVALLLFVLIETLLRRGVVVLEASTTTLAWIVIAIFGIGFIPVLQQEEIFPIYIIGDAASFVTMALMAIVAGIRPAIVSDKRSLSLMIVMLGVAAFVGLTIGGQFQGERFAGRFDPPHMLLFAAAASYCLFSMRRATTITAALAMIALFMVALLSGQRTAPIAFVLVAIFAVGSMIGTRKTFVLIGLLSLTIGLVIMSYGGALYSRVAETIAERASESRYEGIATSGEDASLEGRLLEAIDVITIATEQSAAAWLIGYGHGATYRPILSFPEPNVTKAGFVHNIHVGPFLLFYRYGLIGVILYLSLAVLIIKDFGRIRRAVLNNKTPSSRDRLIVFMTYYIAVAGSFANFHLRTVLNDPIFVYSLVGYIVTRGRAHTFSGKQFGYLRRAHNGDSVVL